MRQDSSQAQNDTARGRVLVFRESCSRHGGNGSFREQAPETPLVLSRRKGDALESVILNGVKDLVFMQQDSSQAQNDTVRGQVLVFRAACFRHGRNGSFREQAPETPAVF